MGPRRRRTWALSLRYGSTKGARKRVIEVGEGLSAAGVSAGGVSAGSKRASKKKGEGVFCGAQLSLNDVGATHGQPEPTIRAKATVKAEGADKAVGGRLRGRRISIEKEVMMKHGLNLIAASKYVKEHTLS